MMNFRLVMVAVFIFSFVSIDAKVVAAPAAASQVCCWVPFEGCSMMAKTECVQNPPAAPGTPEAKTVHEIAKDKCDNVCCKTTNPALAYAWDHRCTCERIRGASIENDKTKCPPLPKDPTPKDPDPKNTPKQYPKTSSVPTH